MNQMKQGKLFRRVIGLIVILAFSAACGASEVVPTPHTPTPLPLPLTPTPLPATPTPLPATPTPTPALIPGIDEPITLEERDVEFLIQGVDLEAGEEAGQTALIVKYGPPFDFTDAEWIAGNSQLTCGTTSYPTSPMGFFVGDAGRIEYFRLIFAVPEDVNLLECKLNVADGIEIPLASLPE